MLQLLVEKKKTPFWMGRQGALHWESSPAAALGEEAQFAPAEMWRPHPNRRAWKNGDLGRT